MRSSRRYKWVELENGYWLKIVIFRPSINMWCYDPNLYMIDIAVGKTKRVVNDHYNRTRKSPKSLWLKSTNNKGGIEALIKTLHYILDLEKILPNGSILRVEGSDDKRTKVYSRLLRYGFYMASFYAPGCRWHKNVYYFKEIR